MFISKNPKLQSVKNLCLAIIILEMYHHALIQLSCGDSGLKNVNDKMVCGPNGLHNTNDKIICGPNGLKIDDNMFTCGPAGLKLEDYTLKTTL